MDCLDGLEREKGQGDPGQEMSLLCFALRMLTGERDEVYGDVNLGRILSYVIRTGNTTEEASVHKRVPK